MADPLETLELGVAVWLGSSVCVTEIVLDDETLLLSDLAFVGDGEEDTEDETLATVPEATGLTLPLPHAVLVFTVAVEIWEGV